MLPTESRGQLGTLLISHKKIPGLASHRGSPGSHPGLASGICGGQNGAGAGFLRVFRFPLPITFHSTNFSILTIIRDKYNRPIHGRGGAWTFYMHSTFHYSN
jgi:hypothetical protein